MWNRIVKVARADQARRRCASIFPVVSRVVNQVSGGADGRSSDPSWVDQLPTEQIPKALVQLAGLHCRLAARLAMAPQPGVASADALVERAHARKAVGRSRVTRSHAAARRHDPERTGRREIYSFQYRSSRGGVEGGLTRMGKVTDIARAAALPKREPPQPLVREVPPGEPFPTEALPGLLGDTVRAACERTQAPLSLCAQSLMATTALVVQAQGNVELPTGAVKPISEYFGTIAATGERKTSADDWVSQAIKERELELDITYRIELVLYQNRLAAYERQRHQVLSNRKSNPDLSSKEQALAKLGPPPTPPMSPLLTVPEPTFEGLTRFLKDGQPSVGLFSTEGGQFIGGHAMSEENRLKTAAGFSRLWDDGEARRSRQGEGTYVVRGRRVSMHLQVQPDAAARFFADLVLQDQGLLSRFLTVWPVSTIGYRKSRKPSDQSAAILDQYRQRALAILRSQPPLIGNELRRRL